MLICGHKTLFYAMRSPRPVHPQVGAPKSTRESVPEKESEKEGEFVFDLISESENERLVAYYLVMAHGYLDDDSAQGPVH